MAELLCLITGDDFEEEVLASEANLLKIEEETDERRRRISEMKSNLEFHKGALRWMEREAGGGFKEVFVKTRTEVDELLGMLEGAGDRWLEVVLRVENFLGPVEAEKGGNVGIYEGHHDTSITENAKEEGGQATKEKEGEPASVIEETIMEGGRTIVREAGDKEIESANITQGSEMELQSSAVTEGSLMEDEPETATEQSRPTIEGNPVVTGENKLGNEHAPVRGENKVEGIPVVTGVENRMENESATVIEESNREDERTTVIEESNREEERRPTTVINESKMEVEGAAVTEESKLEDKPATITEESKIENEVAIITDGSKRKDEAATVTEESKVEDERVTKESKTDCELSAIAESKNEIESAVVTKESTIESEPAVIEESKDGGKPTTVSEKSEKGREPTTVTEVDENVGEPTTVTEVDEKGGEAVTCGSEIGSVTLNEIENCEKVTGVGLMENLVRKDVSLESSCDENAGEAGSSKSDSLVCTDKILSEETEKDGQIIAGIFEPTVCTNLLDWAEDGTSDGEVIEVPQAEVSEATEDLASEGGSLVVEGGSEGGKPVGEKIEPDNVPGSQTLFCVSNLCPEVNVEDEGELNSDKRDKEKFASESSSDVEVINLQVDDDEDIFACDTDSSSPWVSVENKGVSDEVTVISEGLPDSVEKNTQVREKNTLNEVIVDAVLKGNGGMGDIVLDDDVEKEDELCERALKIKRMVLMSSSEESSVTSEDETSKSESEASAKEAEEKDITEQAENVEEERRPQEIEDSGKENSTKMEEKKSTEGELQDDVDKVEREKCTVVMEVEENTVKEKNVENNSLEKTEENPVEKIEDEKESSEEKNKEIDSKNEETTQKEEDLIAKEDEELHRLMDLRSLGRKVRSAVLKSSESDNDADDESAGSEAEDSSKDSKNNGSKKAKKEKPKEESFLQYFRSNTIDSDDEDEGGEGEGEGTETDSDNDDTKKKFLMTNGMLLKEMLLDTSDAETGSESSNSSVEEKKKETPEKKKRKNRGSDEEDSPQAKRPSWQNDKLLQRFESELSSSGEEARWLAKREREKKKRREHLELMQLRNDATFIPSESSDEPDVEVFAVKMKKPRAAKSDSGDSSEDDKPPKVEKLDLTSDSSTDDAVSTSQTGQDTPSKGRKNIKKILKKEALHVETKQALKLEVERKKRVAERMSVRDETYPADEGKKPSRLVLDFDPETKEPLVSVQKKLVKRLKPHQALGVRFMWDNCFESLQRLEEDSGSGCILAHCMGLGKTFQVVTLVHTILTHDTGVHTVLVVCPLNTVSNWLYEFDLWLQNVSSNALRLYDITKYKKTYERTFQISDWQKNGGVLVLSYDMFRNFTGEKRNLVLREKDKGVFESSLVNPGPDLVICDEGHLLKNVDTALSKCMSKIKTLRRIVLTGTPLQNNLNEYHCMVQFIKPNILGSRKEFMNRFVNPINNGQFEDSTEADVKLMKRRSHVLHTILDGCIQRFDYSVLTPFLPPKHEFVIAVALTEPQVKAYRFYLERHSYQAESVKGAKLFSDYNNLQRIWTHPLTLYAHSQKVEKKDGKAGSIKSKKPAEDEGHSSDSVILVENIAVEPKKPEKPKEPEKLKPDWWKDYFKVEDCQDMRASGKLLILFSLLKECKTVGDKVLVFSQSLYTLDLIEHFLCKVNEASTKTESNEELAGHRDTWCLGRDYFRLDGSTSSEQRALWCRCFNKPDNQRARLFLISTRAGGLGINLVAANRVVVFSASWNPSHDVQSIFRVFRFGQNKPCFIYRLLAEGTMEEKIYERQVAKLSLARRVVDEHQIERHYTMRTLNELYNFDPTPKESWKTPIVPKDVIFANILKTHEDLVVSYHEHDSLLENKEEEELTEEERKAAWEDFEKEKLSVPPPQPDIPPMFSAENMKHDVLRTMEQYKMTVAQPGQRRTQLMPLNSRTVQLPVNGNMRSYANQRASCSVGHERDPLSLEAGSSGMWQRAGSENNMNQTQMIQSGQQVGIVPHEGESLDNFRARVDRKRAELLNQRYFAITSRK